MAVRVRARYAHTLIFKAGFSLAHPYVEYMSQALNSGNFLTAISVAEAVLVSDTLVLFDVVFVLVMNLTFV